MPILNLQRSLVELGRIRIGMQVTRNGKSRPEKLETFRFTTASEDRAKAVAGSFGGDVRPWDNDGKAQWEVISPADAIPVVVPPGQSVTQWYELWSGGGCQRRCDGMRNVLRDVACECPADPVDRNALAANGKACKPTTRLSVILPDVPGLGVWRLETHGYYAATELAGVAEFLAAASAQGRPLPAVLRLEQRSGKRDGQTRRWAVPVLDPAATPAALLAGDYAGPVAPAALPAQAAAALPASPPVPAQELAALALGASTLDELRAVWDQASADDQLAALVDPGNGTSIPLGDMLRQVRMGIDA